MDTTYDIFKRLDDAGPPLWMETVGNLDQARQRLAGLAKQRGTYLVFDPRMGRIIEMPETLAERGDGLRVPSRTGTRDMAAMRSIV